MLAVFLDGPMDGQELEVEPLTVIVFPEAEISAVYHGRDEPVRPRVRHHTYTLQTEARLTAIRASSFTPSYIKIQMSQATLLYEYEGQDG